ncbi:guanylate kinase-associated protein mars isoform X2 [Drosophila serrata]|uniref:guanylate kinase-associated protein mars isoform X2 n=1 Tax=Drosophila serrata TaxID=7274 RepID=UPI000A1D2118|nr:guanylate kinase-associated protein mars isoform X2 [Drosophila serrata]
MQRHKELYKEQSLVLSPRNHIQTNRERQQERRAKNREECFQNNRIISVSPTPVKAKPQQHAEPQQQSPTPVAPKENEAPASVQEQNVGQAVPPNKKDGKTARHQQFLERFKKWNAARKEEHKMQELLRRGQPVKPTSGLAIKPASSIPTSAVFRPPVIVQHPPQKKEDENEPVFKAPKKRQSLYVIVNPKSKVMEQKKVAAAPQTSRPKIQPAIQSKRPSKPAFSVTKPAPPRKMASAAPPARQAFVEAPVANKRVPSAMPARKPMTLSRSKTTVQTQPIKAKAIGPAPNQPRPQATSLRPRAPVTPATATKMPPQTSGLKTRENVASAKLTAAAQPRPKLSNVMTQPFEKPILNRAPTVGRANIVKPQPVRGGAAGKFKAAGMANKAAGIANKAGGTAARTAHQSIRMKATKGKSNYTRLEENARKLPQLKTELVLASTSTQYRTNNCSGSLQEAFGDVTALSPVASGKKVGVNVAKRQLLPEGNSKKPTSGSKKKFNFTRYSVANSEADESLALEPLQTTVQGDDIETTLVQTVEKTLPHSLPAQKVNEATFVQAAEKIPAHSLPVKEGDGEVTLVQTVEKTPPRRDSEGKSNYLSPFVSVSRGKVNSRSEREKRNSFYLQDGETPAEVRRAIESVMYFRVQLEEEIARLEALCREWEAYSKANEERLQETGGGDMVNVTVGQTRLLTTKKMMQFKGLIDRCEAGAKCQNQLPNDGSEDTKPVQPEDLEGWWDMLRLQSENVDKRFASLERWKANDWLDPDAVLEEAKKLDQAKAKPKAKLTRKVNMKAKAKPSSNLQQFLRKAHANMKKSKLEEAPQDDGIPPTPSRRSSQRVIVVRDRRSFSPARTVLRMSTGEGRSSIAPNALLKTALIAAAEQNAVDRTPPPKSRPSILKTPGTTKRFNRGVIFSAKKSVRRFQFTIEEGNISSEEKEGADKLEDCEEDMSLETSTERRSLDQDMTATAHDGDGQTPRTYGLRNRRVRLRPSSEFM